MWLAHALATAFSHSGKLSEQLLSSYHHPSSTAVRDNFTSTQTDNQEEIIVSLVTCHIILLLYAQRTIINRNNNINNSDTMITV